MCIVKNAAVTAICKVHANNCECSCIFVLCRRICRYLLQQLPIVCPDWLLICNHIQCVFNYSDFPKPCPARDLPCFDETAVPWCDGVAGVLWQNGHKFHVQKIQTKCPSSRTCQTVVTTSWALLSFLTHYNIQSTLQVTQSLKHHSCKCFPPGIGGIMQSQAYLRKM